MTKKSLKPAMDWPDYGSAVERYREREPGMADDDIDDDEPKPDPHRIRWATLGTIVDDDEEEHD
jgi:hypothetical protein